MKIFKYYPSTALCFLFLFLFLPFSLFATSLYSHKEHTELGHVQWLRNYDSALQHAQEKKRPILALFQEVPGCLGCQQFGQSALTHPLLVEAMEDLFIPLAIFNNKGGEDQKILKRYQEPSWNYQVIRYLNDEGKDLIPRKDKIWTTGGTASRMIHALKASNKQIPLYLKTVTWEENTKGHQTAAFAMYCYWDGEGKLGSLDGVITTESGWIDGSEVVKVQYDPKMISWKKLVQAAQKFQCAHRIFAPTQQAVTIAQKLSKKDVSLFRNGDYRIAKASDQKHTLKRTSLSQLTLTPMQATKINAAFHIGRKQEALQWLSPRQKKKLQF